MLSISIILTIIPVIIILLYIYMHDKEKEPKKWIIIMYVLGIISLILSQYLCTIFVDVVPDSSSADISFDTYYQFLLSFSKIGFLEELAKWIIFKVFIWKNKNYNYMYDGIVYAVCISLGFATIENLKYLEYGNIMIAIIRAIFTIPAHAVFGIFMGYNFSCSKQELMRGYNVRSNYYHYASFIIPLVVHGIYDFILTIESEYTNIIFVIFVVILYIIAFTKISKLSKYDEKF